MFKDVKNSKLSCRNYHGAATSLSKLLTLENQANASKPLDLALYVYMNIACINMHTFNMQVKVCLDVHPCRYDAHSSRPRVSSMP